MKNFIEGFLTCILLLTMCFGIYLFVKADKAQSELNSVSVLPIFKHTTTPINYDSLCVIGGRYTIYPFDYKTNNNPFDKGTPAHVTIVAKKDGYVLYAYTKYLKTKCQCNFTRSCEEFIYLVNLYK